VVCAGLATVDLVYRVDRVPGVDEKAQADAVEIAAGGPAANAAVTAAALGARVTLVSAVGAHPLGDLIRADLAEHGVTLLDAAPGHPGPPPVSAVTVESGTGRRTIVSRNAADAAVSVPAGLDDVLAGADVVLVDGHHPALAVAAARAAPRLVVDAGSWRPVFADILPHADVVACSAAFRHPGATEATPRPRRPGAAAVVDKSAADGSAATAALLRDLGVPHVAVTRGPEPVRWWSGPHAGEVPVPPVVAVDTAGAGDVFHGALAVAVARDPDVTDLPAALRFASRVAGVRVRHAGPRRWLRELRAGGVR
jgi:sugar/nucleoside kinase (ribokinase family)